LKVITQALSRGALVGGMGRASLEDDGTSARG
jgi:hypothetical protein